MIVINAPKDNLPTTSFREVVGILQKGDVAVLPTDTLYGLSCLANNETAIKKIKRIKGRGENKPFLILVSSLSMLKKYVYLSNEQEIILKKLWSSSRATTVIFKHKKVLPKILTGNFDTLAVRLPKDVFLIKIIKELGTPIVSTSLNQSGHDVISDPKLVPQIFKGTNSPDLLLDAGKCRRKKPSRLLDASREEKIIILRK